MSKVTNTNQAFKKSSAVIGHPPVTDHNIDDDYVKDPPRNTEHPVERTGNSGLKEGNPKEPGVPEDAHLGRVTKEAELAEIVHEDSVHP